MLGHALDEGKLGSDRGLATVELGVEIGMEGAYALNLDLRVEEEGGSVFECMCGASEEDVEHVILCLILLLLLLLLVLGFRVRVDTGLVADAAALAFVWKLIGECTCGPAVGGGVFWLGESCPAVAIWIRVGIWAGGHEQGCWFDGSWWWSWLADPPCLCGGGQHGGRAAVERERSKLWPMIGVA